MDNKYWTSRKKRYKNAAFEAFSRKNANTHAQRRKIHGEKK